MIQQAAKWKLVFSVTAYIATEVLGVSGAAIVLVSVSGAAIVLRKTCCYCAEPLFLLCGTPAVTLRNPYFYFVEPLLLLCGTPVFTLRNPCSYFAEPLFLLSRTPACFSTAELNNIHSYT